MTVWERTRSPRMLSELFLWLKELEAARRTSQSSRADYLLSHTKQEEVHLYPSECHL